MRRNAAPPEGYTAAVEEALDRLRSTGFEFGGFLSCHAPMAAEALSELGYADHVPQWVRGNLRQRPYLERPAPRWPIAAADWRTHLGDFGRVADWTALFERELAGEPWPDVLARWWPRLLPGLVGALGHGLIRTVHAARSVASSPRPTKLQLDELAQGLGYWAARYTEPRGPGSLLFAEVPPTAGDDPEGALRELALTAAGVYADRSPRPPIPLVHMVTVPAAVHLVLPALPVELHEQSYHHARRAAEWIAGVFAGMFTATLANPGSAPPDLGETIARAVELGDEHAIKLAEACHRLGLAGPDDRLRRAPAALVGRLVRG
ncbi:questin oxidase family protein [Paractinoplanes ferrugineus]|nr:questin oxidase family protein [Actinoplanes ferrugineus]